MRVMLNDVTSPQDSRAVTELTCRSLARPARNKGRAVSAPTRCRDKRASKELRKSSLAKGRVRRSAGRKFLASKISETSATQRHYWQR